MAKPSPLAHRLVAEVLAQVGYRSNAEERSAAAENIEAYLLDYDQKIQARIANKVRKARTRADDAYNMALDDAIATIRNGRKINR